MVKIICTFPAVQLMYVRIKIVIDQNTETRKKEKKRKNEKTKRDMDTAKDDLFI